jgi:hypothetical protein
MTPQMTKHKPILRLLAVDPMPRGFGFAVIERERLVDWGLKHIGPSNPERVQATKQLIHRYAPSFLVVEDMEHPECQKGARARKLFVELRALASELRVNFVAVSWRMVRERVGGGADANKEIVAQNACILFPELELMLPLHRKIWQSESPRMSVFDATALGIAFMEQPAQKAAKRASR